MTAEEKWVMEYLQRLLCPEFAGKGKLYLAPSTMSHLRVAARNAKVELYEAKAQALIEAMLRKEESA